MALNHHVASVADNAHYVTYTAAASTLTVWGLHISEIAVMVSSLAAVCGAVIQILMYLDRRPGRKLGTDNDGETH